MAHRATWPPPGGVPLCPAHRARGRPLPLVSTLRVSGVLTCGLHSSGPGRTVAHRATRPPPGGVPPCPARRARSRPLPLGQHTVNMYIQTPWPPAVSSVTTPAGRSSRSGPGRRPRGQMGGEAAARGRPPTARGSSGSPPPPPQAAAASPHPQSSSSSLRRWLFLLSPPLPPPQHSPLDRGRGCVDRLHSQVALGRSKEWRARGGGTLLLRLVDSDPIEGPGAISSTVFCAFVTWMAWHYPAGPAGRPPLRFGPRAAPGSAGRDRFTPCAVTSTVTVPST